MTDVGLRKHRAVAQVHERPLYIFPDSGTHGSEYWPASVRSFFYISEQRRVLTLAFAFQVQAIALRVMVSNSLSNSGSFDRLSRMAIVEIRRSTPILVLPLTSSFLASLKDKQSGDGSPTHIGPYTLLTSALRDHRGARGRRSIAKSPSPSPHVSDDQLET